MADPCSISIPRPKDWQLFERNARILFAQVLQDPLTKTNGRSGQRQHGVDIYGRRGGNGAHVGIQCRGKDSTYGKPVSVSELRDAVHDALDFQPQLDEFILITAAPDDQRIEEEARLISQELEKAGRPLRVSVWGWNTLEQHISMHREAYRAFYPDAASIPEHLLAITEDTRKHAVVIRRIVDRLFNNSAKKYVFQMMIAILGWFLWNFFEPFTIHFMSAAMCIVISSILGWFRRYLSATAMCTAFVAYCLTLPFTATFILVSDQQRMGYREVGGTSYLEFPLNSTTIRLMPTNFFRQKLISIISCDGLKLAKLPLLPFSTVKADKALFSSPLQFRRLLSLSYNILRAYVQTDVGSGDHEKSISFGLGFSYSSDSMNLTDIFQRSISCMESSTPLVPIMEILPWHPDQTNQLIAAVEKVFVLRNAYLSGQITPEIVRSITLQGDDSEYKTLLDFTSDYFKFIMLQGNMFAETRADIRNQTCITVESNPIVFKGPFSFLSKQLKRELAYAGGRAFKFIYPACHIEDEIFSEIEGQSADSQEVPNWLMAMADCSHTETADELLSCLGNSTYYRRRKDENCEAIRCGASLTATVSPEEIVRYYEKPFEDRVVSVDGHLIEPSTLDSIECPALRDSFEELYLLNWRGARAWSIWNEPPQCSSPDWQSRFMQSKEAKRAQLRCARKKGFGGMTEADADVDTMYDAFHMLNCNREDREMQSRSLREFIRLFEGLSEFKTELLNNYADWIGQKKTKEIIDALTELENIKDILCGSRDSEHCINDLRNPDVRERWYSNIMKIFGQIASAAPDLPSQVKAYFDALSLSDNIIVRIALCDLLSLNDISELMGMSRDAYCRSHGLSKYMMVSERYEGRSAVRTYETRDRHERVETREYRIVSPSGASKSYGRDWGRELDADFDKRR